MEEELKDEIFLIRQRIKNIESELENFSGRISASEKKCTCVEKPTTVGTLRKEAITSDLNRLIKEYFSISDYKFVPGQTKIPLQAPSYGPDEVIEALDSLLSTWVTMGKKVQKFEEEFSKYLGAKYGVMVHSGSSANLLALSVLSNNSLDRRILPGDEIITPATTWATTVNPIADIGAVPVIVDVNLDTFNINTDAIRDAITDKTKAIIPVHLLGNPANIKEIMEIAQEKDLFVIEDTCESHGAEVDGKKVGTFGDMSTFSFFFSHHITTIEGGMLVTNNEDYSELARALRVFGWARNLKKYEEYARTYSNIDKRFLFVNKGFNLRPTEIQGAFGIHQIKKLDDFIEIRRENAKYWNKRFSEVSDFLIIQEERAGTKHVWFGYPLTVRQGAPFTREELVKHLEENKIETRPIQVPNIAKQPSINFFNHRIQGNLENAQYIMDNSFWFGNHQAIGKEERDYIADKVIEFIENKASK